MHASFRSSSAVSSDVGGANSIRSKLSLSFLPKPSFNRPKNRDSVAASSGYESATGIRESENQATTSPDSGSEASSGVRSPPGCRLPRKAFAVGRNVE